LPNIDEPLLQELAEILVIDWFTKTQRILMTPMGVIMRYPIYFPRIGRRHVTVKPCDILKMFGVNRFTEIVCSSTNSLFGNSVLYVPSSFRIYTKRYKYKTVNIGMGVDGATLYETTLIGTPGGIELGFKGSLLNPLKFFALRIYVNRVAYGDLLMLHLIGFNPTLVGKDEIVLDNGSIIRGEELNELRKWIEIDYNIIVTYKIRGWLFFHKEFLEIVAWGQHINESIKQYFDIAENWDKIKIYQRSYVEQLKILGKHVKT